MRFFILKQLKHNNFGLASQTRGNNIIKKMCNLCVWWQTL